MQVITQKTLDLIKTNYKVIGRLVAVFEVHPRTISNWIDKNDVHLTNPTAIDIIKEETGLSESEILTEKQAA
jgi:hypothetical protein